MGTHASSSDQPGCCCFDELVELPGVTMIVVSVPFGRRRPSGYLAAVFTWIAVVFFVFVTLGRREQADLFAAGRTDLLLDGEPPRGR